MFRFGTVAGTLVLVCCSTQEVHLKYQHRAGVPRRYTLSVSTSARIGDSLSASEFASTAQMEILQRVTQVYTNGDARYEIVLDDVSYSADSFSLPELQNAVRLLRNAVLTARLSPFGDFLEMEGLEDLPRADIAGVDLSRLLLKMVPVLPRSPIRVGGEWDRQQQMPVDNGLSKGTLYLSKRFRLLSVAEYRNRPCAKIGFDMVVHMGIKESLPFQFKSKHGSLGRGSGTLYFDLREGFFVEGDLYLSAKMEASLRDPATGRQLSFPVEMEQRLRLTMKDMA